MQNKYNNLLVTEHYIVKNSKDYIYLDVNSLDVIVIDELDNQILSAFKNKDIGSDLTVLSDQYGKNVINEHINDFLINGVLLEKSENKKTNTNGQKNQMKPLEAINSINVQISEDCNLVCQYCFVKENQYSNKTAHMHLNQGIKVVDFLIERSDKIDDLYVFFFGGEPLLNFTVMKEMVDYALEKGKTCNKRFHFSLTTNGTLLSNDILDFIGINKIWVVLSIDGNSFSQDMNRPFQGGKGSYSSIDANIKKMAEKNISFSARVTVSALTANKIAENYEHLILLGFKKVHFENALAPSGEIFINQKEKVEEIKKQYQLISEKVTETINMGQACNFESLPFPLGKIVSKNPGHYSCTAGNGYVSVAVNGDIYLCHRLVGVSNFHLGNVNENNYKLHWLETIKNELDVDKRKKCSKCWARYICGGGCYETNYNFNNDISLAPGIYCQIMKYKIELAICLYAEVAE
jgi:uncharacterized protein